MEEEGVLVYSGKTTTDFKQFSLFLYIFDLSLIYLQGLLYIKYLQVEGEPKVCAMEAISEEVEFKDDSLT